MTWPVLLADAGRLIGVVLLGLQVWLLFVLLARLAPGYSRRPPIAPRRTPRTDTTVTVMVTTLNEVNRVGPCLDGLMQQEAPLLAALTVARQPACQEAHREAADHVDCQRRPRERGHCLRPEPGGQPTPGLVTQGSPDRAAKGDVEGGGKRRKRGHAVALSRVGPCCKAAPGLAKRAHFD